MLRQKVYGVLGVVAMATMMTAACAQSDSGITTAVKSKLAADDAAGARGQAFQLLPEDAASEIQQADSEEKKARLVCDFLAGMTDGYAARMYKRLFTPDFGSIGDLIG